jgi:hypothetical protein
MEFPQSSGAVGAMMMPNLNKGSLAGANAQKNRLKTLGLLKVSTPIQKARANPNSLRKAITAFCFECVGGDGEPGARNHVRDCTAKGCPLFRVRPWQKQQIERNPAEVKQ